MPNTSYNRATVVSNNPQPRRVFYTGKTVNATKASRTNIAQDSTSALTTARTIPRIGSVLCRDPYGQDNGVGIDFVRPATAVLSEQKVVIVGMDPYWYTDTATDGFGRYVDVMDVSEDISVMLEGNPVSYMTTWLGVLDASFCLTNLATGTAGILSVAVIATVAAEVEAVLTRGCAKVSDITIAAQNYSVTPAAVRCSFNASFSCIRPNY